MKLGRYQHYKGNFYEVIGVAHHSETLEELVVYRALYKHEVYGDNSLWVRPKKMFLKNVIIEGKEISRFTLIEN
jgi:cyclomaltodextrinase / maltogenic alpha-amylase / neopullulanase